MNKNEGSYFGRGCEMASNVQEPQAQLDLRDAFREAMATVCSPVSVVTVLCAGEAYGTTVSAFTSLSLDPPMVLLAMDLESRSFQALSSTGIFGLNVLSDRQVPEALAFARKGGPEKFEDTAWQVEQGVPRLLEAPAFLVCELSQSVRGGDHMVLLARVRWAESREDFPLTYYKRTFGTHHAV